MHCISHNWVGLGTGKVPVSVGLGKLPVSVGLAKILLIRTWRVAVNYLLWLAVYRIAVWNIISCTAQRKCLASTPRAMVNKSVYTTGMFCCQAHLQSAKAGADWLDIKKQ